jgi:hypothetical protein
LANTGTQKNTGGLKLTSYNKHYIKACIKQVKIKSQRIGRPILITENNLKEFLTIKN